MYQTFKLKLILDIIEHCNLCLKILIFFPLIYYNFFYINIVTKYQDFFKSLMFYSVLNLYYYAYLYSNAIIFIYTNAISVPML